LVRNLKVYTYLLSKIFLQSSYWKVRKSLVLQKKNQEIKTPHKQSTKEVLWGKLTFSCFFFLWSR
jgi:hypothetical protein